MEFTRDTAAGPHAIVACSAREVRLPARTVEGSAIVTRDAVIENWRPPDVELLEIGHFDALLAQSSPDVVLLGTGDRQRLPPRALYAEFAARGVGLEAMDNRAACRTYNLLLAEFRDVAVALMLERSP